MFDVIPKLGVVESSKKSLLHCFMLLNEAAAREQRFVKYKHAYYVPLFAQE